VRKLLFALVATSVAVSVLSSPARATTFTNGEFFSYDQNIWGADPGDGPPASILKADFFTVFFPAGAEFGNPAPGGFVMDFSSADAMLTYLPQSGPPGALNASLTDPTSTTAGFFGGEVVALRLNIAFSDAGLFFDPLHFGATMAHPPGVAFGDLILTGFTGSLAGLDGQTLRQLQDTANIMLGAGAEPYSIADVAPLLVAINNSFGGGMALKGDPFSVDDHLLLPATTGGVPEPAAWTLLLIGFAALGGAVRHRRRATDPNLA
jgi:PEP-CTERM motif-containing protein